VKTVVQEGIMSGYKDANGNPTGVFAPGSSMTAGEALKILLTVRGVSVAPAAPGQLWTAPYLDQAQRLNLTDFLHHSSLSSTISKGEFLHALTVAFKSELNAVIASKSKAQYTQVWNAIPSTVSNANAVRLAILAGWIDMPNGSLRASSPLSRAEAAKIILNVAAMVQGKGTNPVAVTQPRG
jgi:hypothetical protein